MKMLKGNKIYINDKNLILIYLSMTVYFVITVPNNSYKDNESIYCGE